MYVEAVSFIISKSSHADETVFPLVRLQGNAIWNMCWVQLKWILNYGEALLFSNYWNKTVNQRVKPNIRNIVIHKILYAQYGTWINYECSR